MTELEGSVQTRDLKPDDYPFVMNLIDQTWNYREYGLNERFCYRKALRDLYSSLAESDYQKVLLYRDQVVGFIFANTGKNNKVERKSHYLKKIRKLEKENAHYSEGILINQYAQLFKDVNTQLLNNSQIDKEAELVYFTIDKNYRGLGLGKRLISELVGYLLEKCVNSLFLFTDSTCNIDFYKRYGFTKKAETTGYADLRDETLQFYLFALEDLHLFDPLNGEDFSSET